MLKNIFGAFRRRNESGAKDKNREVYINNNPTEEQLRDNKNGRVAMGLSILACVLLLAIICFVVFMFGENFVVGLFSIFLLMVPARIQLSAVKRAKKQLSINGKGKIKFLLVQYVFPIASAFIAVSLLFLCFGKVINFK